MVSDAALGAPVSRCRSCAVRTDRPHDHLRSVLCSLITALPRPAVLEIALALLRSLLANGNALRTARRSAIATNRCIMHVYVTLTSSSARFEFAAVPVALECFSAWSW